MNENLTKKDYAKYDRQFMAFGSIMNSLGQMLQAGKTIAVINGKEMTFEQMTDWAWNWAKKNVSEFVDELYEDNNGEKAL